MNLLGLPLGAVGMMGPQKMAKRGLFGAPAAFATNRKKDEEKPFLETTSGKLSAIGDILLRASGNGGNPHFGMMMQQQLMKQRMHQQEQLAEQQRQATNQEWYNRERYKRANPMPTAPDAFEKALLGAGIDPNSDQGRELFNERAKSMAGGRDEFVVVPIPGLGTYAGPKSGLADAMERGQPDRPKGRLKPIGGGAPSGTGMFPGN